MDKLAQKVRIAELEAERDAAVKELRNYVTAIPEWAEKDKARIAHLEAALERYGHHVDGCGVEGRSGACRCGYAQALSTLDPTEAPSDTYPEVGETTLDTINRHLSKRDPTEAPHG